MSTRRILPVGDREVRTKAGKLATTGTSEGKGKGPESRRNTSGGSGAVRITEDRFGFGEGGVDGADRGTALCSDLPRRRQSAGNMEYGIAPGEVCRRILSLVAGVHAADAGSRLSVWIRPTGAILSVTERERRTASLPPPCAFPPRHIYWPISTFHSRRHTHTPESSSSTLPPSR